MRGARSIWTLFTLCVAAVFVAMLCLTIALLKMERRAAQARADVAFEQSARLALWRIESSLTPLLTREASRPHFHYVPFYSPDRSYTRMLRPLRGGEVIVPSPLLVDEVPFCKVHFQVVDGVLSSPRIPAGNLLDLAEAEYVDPNAIRQAEQQLSNLNDQRLVDQLVPLARKSIAIEQESGPSWIADKTKRATSTKLPDQRQRLETANTARRTKQLDVMQTRDAETIDVSPLVPIWVDTADDVELFLVRTVSLEGEVVVQGVWVDWPALAERFANQIVDLLPGATVRPVTTGVVEAASVDLTLQSIPAILDVGSPTALRLPVVTLTRATLVVAWIGVIIAATAIAFGVNAMAREQARKSRFVSAVTHELRTPLTTFQLYTQLLADGTVKDPEKRATYIHTLRRESSRLARIVENVLSYARLSDMPAERDSSSLRVGEILDEVGPALQERATEEEMTLDVDISCPDAHVDADIETIARILTNIVDNACKYATDSADRRIHLTICEQNAGIRWRIADHGEGFLPEDENRVFGAFERGRADRDRARSGLGLGLALSQGLARELGGRLEIVHCDGFGGVLDLWLPASRTE